MKSLNKLPLEASSPGLWLGQPVLEPGQGTGLEHMSSAAVNYGRLGRGPGTSCMEGNIPEGRKTRGNKDLFTPCVSVCTLCIATNNLPKFPMRLISFSVCREGN